MIIPTGARPEAVCAKHPDRFSVHLPWYAEGHVYATNGRIAVKIPVADYKKDKAGSIRLDALQIMRKAKRDEHKLVMLKGGVDVPHAKATLEHQEQARTPDVDALIDKAVKNNKFRIRLDTKLLEKLARSMGTQAVEICVDADDLSNAALVKPLLHIGRNNKSVEGAVGLIMPIKEH